MNFPILSSFQIVETQNSAESLQKFLSLEDPVMRSVRLNVESPALRTADELNPCAWRWPFLSEVVVNGALV